MEVRPCRDKNGRVISAEGIGTMLIQQYVFVRYGCVGDVWKQSLAPMLVISSESAARIPGRLTSLMEEVLCIKTT